MIEELQKVKVAISELINRVAKDEAVKAEYAERMGVCPTRIIIVDPATDERSAPKGRDINLDGVLAEVFETIDKVCTAFSRGQVPYLAVHIEIDQAVARLHEAVAEASNRTPKFKLG